MESGLAMICTMIVLLPMSRWGTVPKVAVSHGKAC